jgi:hypothetical protein
MEDEVANIDGWGELIANDSILPSQFAEMRQSTIRDPYVKLWFAVLEDAVRCLAGRAILNGGAGKYIKRKEARTWVANTDHHLGSFEFVCEVCGIGADKLREELLTWDIEGGPHIPRRGSTVRTKELHQPPPRQRFMTNRQ